VKENLTVYAFILERAQEKKFGHRPSSSYALQATVESPKSYWRRPTMGLEGTVTVAMVFLM